MGGTPRALAGSEEREKDFAVATRARGCLCAPQDSMKEASLVLSAAVGVEDGPELEAELEPELELEPEAEAEAEPVPEAEPELEAEPGG